MARYRKRPIEVEAVQWFSVADPVQEVRPHKPAVRDSVCTHCGVYLMNHGSIETLEGRHIVCPGDWIITGVNGERDTCKPDVFQEAYEPVEEEAE